MSKTINRLLLWVVGCVSFLPMVAAADPLEDMIRSRSNSAATFSQPLRSTQTQTPDAISKEQAGDLIMNAMGLIGLSYIYGGNNPEQGLDCSAFMQYIFKQSMKVSLPRTSAEQANVGSHVERSQIQPGDMVFFRTVGGSRISHVGMYIGNDRFIHAPRTGKNIEITSLSSKYWGSKYATARRVSGAGKAAASFR